MAVQEPARARHGGDAGARFGTPVSTRAEMLAESRSLLRLAMPITLAQLGGMAMTTMDTIMVGPLGAEALAALGLSGSLHFALLVITMGTLFGMGPLVSQAFGAGDRSQCQAVLVQGLWIAVALTIPVFAVNAVGEPLALALGQEPAVASVVGRYMWALAWGVPAMLLFVAFRQYLEGMSLTQPALVITLIGLGINYFANRTLIYGVDGVIEPMGAVGAGWATSLVRWAMLMAIVGWVIGRPELRPARAAGFRLRRGTLSRIVHVGLPTGAQVGMETGFFAFAAVMMGWFGGAELGTHQVTINLAATTFMVALGISIAGSIRVGQRIGARDPDGARRVVVVTYVFATASMGFFALLFLAMPESLLRLYTNDPVVIQLGTSLLFVAALFQVFDGAQVAGFSVLRGAADTRVPMLIAAAAYWIVGAPIMFLLGFRTTLGPVGVWAGMVVGLAVAAGMLAWRVRAIHWGRGSG
jgi:MATE family multidrug resistance protein